MARPAREPGVGDPAEQRVTKVSDARHVADLAAARVVTLRHRVVANAARHHAAVPLAEVDRAILALDRQGTAEDELPEGVLGSP